VVLAEIVCPTRELADSLSALLVQGADFGALARRHSTAATRARDGYLGRVDLTSYPLTVQMTVTAIGEGEVTKPLRIGDGFVILKRVSEQK
jgi:parvulin-like peptidyl-prolyl isomerase